MLPDAENIFIQSELIDVVDFMSLHAPLWRFS